MLPAVMVMGAMSALLLLIACANIAGLVLVRAVSRRGEIGLRLALGATRVRIVRLLLVENLVLAVPGRAVGPRGGWFGVADPVREQSRGPPPDACSSMSPSIDWWSVSPCWRPASALWRLDSCRRCGARAST